MEQIKDCQALESRKQNSRPTAQDAARRLLVLKYVVVRALSTPPREILRVYFAALDAEAREEFTRDVEKENEEFWQGLRDEGLWQYLSPWEQQYASSTVVTMTHDDQVDASWRVESVQALTWALGLLSALPPYDTMADHDLLKTFPEEDVVDFIGSASLRPRAEIDRAREIAEFWHWRSRERQLIERDEVLPPDEKLKALGFQSFDDIVRFTARKAADEGTIPACIGDDFPARGKAYRELSEHEWSEVRSIAIQRHFTLNWLCGYSPGNRWDETPTET